MSPARRALAAACAAAAALLAGCSRGPDVSEAPDGGSPACAAVVGRVPGTVLDRARSQPQAAGVAVWGDPPVVLRCGVDVPARPSNAPCLAVDGVDWLWENSDDDSKSPTFVTYGRTPAVRVVVAGGDREDASSALVELGAAVAPLPASKHCQ